LVFSYRGSAISGIMRLFRLQEFGGHRRPGNLVQGGIDMSDVPVTGTAGNNGIDGSAPGASGTDGVPGGDAVASNTGSLDANNSAKAYANRQQRRHRCQRGK
jgi:hypothetical protein